jgi:hypothetical protein
MNADRMTASLSTRWICVLVSVLGACEVLMALGAGSALTRATGIVGGVALATAPWLLGRATGAALVLLVVGTVPFAGLTVMSLVSPLLALAAWILMGLIHRARSGPAPVPSRSLSSAHEAEGASM